MTTEATDKVAEARKQAEAQLSSIRDMVKRLEHARQCDGGEECELTDAEVYAGINLYHQGQTATQEERAEYHDEEQAEEVIRNDALSVEVRSGWHSPGEQGEDEEYMILLCTGGPAVRIVGDLGGFGEADSARLECQDWFTPWTDVPVIRDDEQALITYAGLFLGY